MNLVPKGDVEAVEALYNSFCASRDIIYLQSVVRIVKRLAAAHPSNDFLQGLLSDMSRLLVESDIQSSAGSAFDAAPITGMAVALKLQTIIFAVLRFDATGNVGYLDIAFNIAQECIAANPPSEFVQPLHSFISALLSMSPVRTPAEPREVPIEGAVPPARATRPRRIFTDSEKVVEQMLENAKMEITEAFGNLSFSQSNGFDAVDYSIKIKQIMAAKYPLDHPNRPDTLYDLSFLLSRRFQNLGDPNDIAKAIEAAEGVLATTRILDPYQLSNLGSVFLLRFRLQGDIADLEKATGLCEEALRNTPLRDQRRIGCLFHVSVCFSSWFDRMGSLEDLEKAIQGIEETLLATTTGHGFRGLMLQHAGDYYSQRYERLRSVIDLEKAIHATKEALAPPLQDLQARASALANLGVLMSLRFELNGDIDDVETGIAVIQEAVGITPIQGPTRANMLNNLGGLLAMRFRRLGMIQDVELGIQAVQEALATPSDHLIHANRLNTLSALFLYRYTSLGVLGDIEMAVQVNKEAIATAPKDHPNRKRFLSNASAMLCARYGRLGSSLDMDEGICAIEELGPELPLNDSVGMYRYINIGYLFCTRYNKLGDVDDLDIALQAMEMAVAALPLGHQERATQLLKLGKTYYTRFTLFRDISDLEKATHVSQEALATIPADHVNRASVLLLNGRLLLALNPSSTLVRRHALRAMYNAWECTGSPPHRRIEGAIFAAYILISFESWKKASSLLEEAINMLPRLSPRFLERDDQEFNLSHFSSLTALAVSTALHAGFTVTHCLSLLELGRGIIMGFSIDCRSDVSDLRARHPNTFNRYHHLRIKIDPSFLKIEGESHLSSENHRRHRLNSTHKMDEIMSDIRQLPGFERFLLPPSSKSLLAVAAEGPIVIFNATEIRSDAIIITKVCIKSIRLGKMAYADVEQHMGNLPSLVRGKQSTYTSRNEKLEQFLLWLWDVAVEPVFDELMFGAVKDANLPRIWWIGVGALAMAPFHAAGDHSRRSTRNTFCRAISSYTPTIKALSYAREEKLELGPDSRLLLVAMPTTPDSSSTTDTPCRKWKPLKNALKEVEEIADIVKNHSQTTILNSPTATQVLKELPAFHAIHLACHGVSDSKNPSSSHLLLYGTNGPEKLTVGTISKRNIRNAQLAYLSACCTADNASTDLADESIHIASGFQLAGFSHVLGTMWESNDAACRQVAVDFYSELFNGKARHKGHRAVSTAFNRAVKKLRKGALGQPILWASFIHTGA